MQVYIKTVHKMKKPLTRYILIVSLAYYQNVMHCSAYRGKSIECDV